MSTPDQGDDDRLHGAVGDAQQQRHQTARAGHLGEQVEERDRERRRRRGGAHRLLLHAEAQHVGHRVLAGVAQRLGHQIERHDPGDEEADGVEQAVVAVEGDGAGHAEEGGRRQVVAGDGEAVLPAREGGAAGVEVRGLRLLPGDGDDDAERPGDEEAEDEDVDERIAVLGGLQEGHAPAPVSSLAFSADEIGSSFLAA
jgi:hypothetical protein